MIERSEMLRARMSKMIEISPVNRTSVGRNATEWQKYRLAEIPLNGRNISWQRCHCTIALAKYSKTADASIGRLQKQA